jgi:hypothetical protein
MLTDMAIHLDGSAELYISLRSPIKGQVASIKHDIFSDDSCSWKGREKTAIPTEVTNVGYNAFKQLL